MMPTAQALAADLTAKQTGLIEEMSKFKTDDGYDMTAEQVEGFRARNAELDDLAIQFEKARDMEEVERKGQDRLAALTEPRDRPRFAGNALKHGASEVLTLGETWAKHGYLVDRNGNPLRKEDGGAICRKDEDVEAKGFSAIEFKTTMTTSAGFSPENLRSGRVVLSALRPLLVIDLVPMVPLTTGNSYVYMSETTFTNNAAEIAENDGTGAPESALAYTEQTAGVKRIATFLPVTDEQLADVAGMQGLIDGRLIYMVQNRLDGQVVAGNGLGNNISGYMTQITQAQAKGADPVFDAIFKGMIKVMHTGFANPTGIILHPNDWQDIRLTRTTDGIYIMGNPDQPGPERLFGQPLAVTTAATENTAIVGDYTGHSAIVYRQGVEMKVSDSHSDYFIKFLQALRVSVRATLVVFRANAFCKVTGI